jgi:small subunit ribosomal protein S6
MAHHEYETIIIIQPDLDDAETTAIAEKIQAVLADQKCHLLLVDDWGKRRLAYPINKHQKGHYFLFNFLATANVIDELERNIRIDDKIVRFLTVRKAEAVDVDLRIKQAEEQRRLREEQEKARLEAEARAAAEAAEMLAQAEAVREAADARAAAAENAPQGA